MSQSAAQSKATNKKVLIKTRKCLIYLDVVQYELMSLFSCGHLTVSDGLPQCLLGNEGVQVQHRGQTAVQADEFLFVGAEVH